MPDACRICSSKDWPTLPNPIEGWAVTTAVVPVDAILTGKQRFLDKPVMALSDVDAANSALVLGTNPGVHQVLKQRLSDCRGRVIAWDNLGVEF